MGKRFCFVLFLFLFSMAFVSSAHYITGYVNNAKDGEVSDGHVVVMWNPGVGIQDNLTDIVGPMGNSGYSGVYMMDCEMLDNSCSVGDELRLMVIDSGDLYVSNYSSVFVSSAGYDMVENLSLNSVPSVFINYPNNSFYSNQQLLNINCSFEDLDSSGVLSLYGNFSGSWELVDSVSSFYGDYVFSNSVSEGVYSYYCEADDGLVKNRSEERVVVMDFTSPNINSFLLNESFFCGPKVVRVGCDTSDFYGLGEVFIEVVSPLYSENYSASNVSISNFLLDVYVEYIGDWNFSCYSRDLAGNIKKSENLSIYVHSGYPEVSVFSQDISFSNNAPMEGASIIMSAEIVNYGCVSAEDFLVSFFNGDPRDSGVLIDSVVGNVSAFDSDVFSVEYNSVIGKNEIFVYVDSYSFLSETNESDNIDFNILNVPSWQTFFGTIDAVKVLSGVDDMTSWENYIQFNGSVFMADSEAEISWMNLLPIGRDKFGLNSENDFLEMDELFGMSDYNDSVVSIYSEYSQRNFFVNGESLDNVPTVLSTNNSNFYTGILWDSSDSLDIEFDSIEKEDVVFVSNINKNSDGYYGNYDYEITIPAKLREYDDSDYVNVYFYYELN